MSVITFANTKGGAGKTTVALVTATELARRGEKVALIDADPQAWLTRWAVMTPDVPFTFLSGIDEASIEETVKTLKKKVDHIVIDLPAGLTALLAKALGLSDHVFVPVQGCAMDAVGGAQVLEILRELSARCDIRIAHSVILTRINSIITTRALTAVKTILAGRGIALLNHALIERAAYRDMFVTGGTLYQMDAEKVSNLDKAQENARLLVDEIASMLPAKAPKAVRAPRKPVAVKKAA